MVQTKYDSAKTINFFLLFAIFQFLGCKQDTPQIIFQEPTPWFEAAALPDTLLPPEVIQLTTPPKIIHNIEKKVVPLKHPFGVGQPVVTNYGVAEGLPSNVVGVLAIDKTGNLWASGMDFLSKFDGSTFTNYSITSFSGSNSYVSELLVDSKNNLWVGCWDVLYKFNGQSFTHIPLSEDDSNFRIFGFLEDKNGAVWIGSEKGIFCISGDSITRYGTEDGLPDIRVFNIILNKNGRPIARTARGNVLFEGKKFEPFNEIPKSDGINPSLIKTDSQGNIWLRYRKNNFDQLGKFDGEKVTVFSKDDGLDNDGYIREVFEDKSGKIWIAADNQIFNYDGKRFMEFQAEETFSMSQSFVEDDAGNLWISTTNGISRLSFNFMNHLEIPLPSTSKYSYINAVSFDANGQKWVTGYGNNLIRYDRDEATVYDLSAYLGERFIFTFYPDSKGSVWMWTGGPPALPRKLIRFDGENFFVYGSEPGLKLRFIRTITEDKKGNLVFIGDGGVALFNENTFTYLGKEQGFPEYATSFFTDSRNRNWVGTREEGVYVFSSDSVHGMNKQSGLPHNYINEITEDPYGNIWLATDGGASKFDGTKLTNFGEAEGISNLVAGITPDTMRNLLWFSTINGLETLPFDEVNSPNPVFSFYSQRNGFDVISSHIQLNTTYFNFLGVWGTSYNGIYRFDVDQVLNFKPPHLYLRNIRVDNQNLLWSLLMKENPDKKDSLTLLNESFLKFGKPADSEKTKELMAGFGQVKFDSLQKGSLIPENLRLPYNNNSITFEFAAISPSFGKYTQYRYKLDGYDKNWSPFSTKDEAYFGNMSEGKYTFHLEAKSAYGTLSTLNYSFKVLPPWWRTWWAYATYGLILLFFIRKIHLYQKAKTIRRERERSQQKELEQAREIEKAYTELKSTQAQLVQSEKMASLGELTAGIAHEIQNPLNFVNNFSEVNNELLDDLKIAIANNDQQEIEAIFKDLKENENKISNHGKRAESIVKGMLLHSRGSSGKKEPTDINSLCDEYVRLAYHGFRAKDNSFKAEYKLELDDTLPKIEVVPQDFGRVLLNLINNAFYAAPLPPEGGFKDPNYVHKPMVIVKTSFIPPTEGMTRPDDPVGRGGACFVSVKDNGPGIPSSIIDKIFQPFFTTKPTGQGTGLGLSLSYDIVKAHGGELKVESTEGEGTEFKIHLPLNS
ncbi:two-component regulator propeller domain-containing protein [Mariniphaga sp.]|uniref:two-component regulator propeller domain-containing protein n=1 Tax=Mariniphaga sp. TaxID=1954475 RepID=UPI003561F240